MIKHLCICLIIFLLTLPVFADQRIADAHIHYNWDQAEVITAGEVMAKLKAAGVGLAIVAGTPSHLALELKKLGNESIIPFFSPYIHEMGKKDWYLNQAVIDQASAGLKQGLYAGVGEIHFMAGLPPRPDNTIFRQLMSLANQYDVPALIHVDAGNEIFFLDICRQHTEVTIQFAHAGGNLLPGHIEKVLQACPNVWIDLSARDPWRYGGLTDEDGRLKPGWRELVLQYPHRFVVGTDPVWRVTRTQSWDQPDDGWDHFERLLDYHLTWIGDLPKQVQDNILWHNVQKLLKKSPISSNSH